MSTVSTATLVAPYGLAGSAGAVSLIGTLAGSPYTAAVEENTIRRTPASRIASSSATEPPRFADQYWSGYATDSPTSDLAAKWSTASTPSASTLAASLRMSPTVNSAPSGTPARCPVDRSSSTTTSWPAPSSWAATTLPI